MRNGKASSCMERLKLDQEIEIDNNPKCAKKRGIKHCRQCCRYSECWENAEKTFPFNGVVKMVGAMILSALEDLDKEVPPLSKCKTKAQKERRQRILYDKASAENFFNSRIFHYSNMNLEYLRRVYEKKKIHESRY